MVKSHIFLLCVFWLLMPVAVGQDMSVEELLGNLKAENYTGKPVDLDLEDAGIDTLFTRLEEFSGLSLKLSPDVLVQFTAKKTYHFKQVPWDRILSIILGEFRLEAIPMDETVYIQPKKDNQMRIIREDQLQTQGIPLIPSLFYLLAVLVLLIGITGFLLYRKKQNSGKTSSGGLVIDPDKADEIMKRVTYLFEVEKIYRKEEISLQILAEELSIPSYQLSWIINKKMNVTFSGLVNSYRIEEVKKRLASPHDSGETILDIAFDAGFNTKTSFNRVFKKLTRMTPSQYRQRYKVPH